MYVCDDIWSISILTTIRWDSFKITPEHNNLYDHLPPPKNYVTEPKYM